MALFRVVCTHQIKLKFEYIFMGLVRKLPGNLIFYQFLHPNFGYSSKRLFGAIITGVILAVAHVIFSPFGTQSGVVTRFGSNATLCAKWEKK